MNKFESFNDQQFSWQKCNAWFRQENPLNDHRANNQQEKGNKCETCDTILEHGNYLVGHNNTDHMQNFLCHNCDNRYSKDETSRIHTENVHVSKVDKDEAKNEINSTQSSLLKSFDSPSEDEISSYEAEYECNICDGEFIDLESLQQHNDKYHNKSPHEKTSFNPSDRQ